MTEKNEKLSRMILQKYKTESQMAREMGWKRQRLNKIVNGTKIPNVLELNELSEALDASIGMVASFFCPCSHHMSDKSIVSWDKEEGKR